MRRLQVKQPGPRTTVEDLGRRGVARYGVPPGGAFDPVALRAANRLVGNADGAAGLELTLMGPTLENVGDEPLTLALVGASVEPVVSRNGKKTSHPAARAFALQPGDVLRLAVPLRAARAWLAIGGGIEVPSALGSRSTHVPAGFGGLGGRALRAGDTLFLGASPTHTTDRGWIDPVAPGGPLGLLPGPQTDRFDPQVLERLCAGAWQVQPTSDRTGVRLARADDECAAAIRAPSGVPPEGTTLGAIQIPPDGGPILLGPDRPITGGYAKPAVVARGHIGRFARLRPGEAVRFETTTLDEALELDRARRASLPEAIDG